VTGERDSLDHIIRCVDFYADACEHFPVHGDWAGKGYAWTNEGEYPDWIGARPAWVPELYRTLLILR
jgi:hypothetical protein